MTVVELARRTGVTPAVVRYYAHAGVMVPHPLRGGGVGYDESDALRLGLAVGLHRLGIVVEEAPPGPVTPFESVQLVGESEARGA